MGSWTVGEAEVFAREFTARLAADKMCITSGYGSGIGSAVITGVLDEVKRQKYAHFDNYLKLYPFPYMEGDGCQKEIWYSYRKEIIAPCRAAVFMFGNKTDASGECILADGMIEEYEIADTWQAILIPLASTEGAALEIYNRMFLKKEVYPYLKNYWRVLKTERSPEKMAELVMEIIYCASVMQ